MRLRINIGALLRVAIWTVCGAWIVYVVCVQFATASTLVKGQVFADWMDWIHFANGRVYRITQVVREPRIVLVPWRVRAFLAAGLPEKDRKRYVNSEDRNQILTPHGADHAQLLEWLGNPPRLEERYERVPAAFWERIGALEVDVRKRLVMSELSSGLEFGIVRLTEGAFTADAHYLLPGNATGTKQGPGMSEMKSLLVNAAGHAPLLIVLVMGIGFVVGRKWKHPLRAAAIVVACVMLLAQRIAVLASIKLSESFFGGPETEHLAAKTAFQCLMLSLPSTVAIALLLWAAYCGTTED